MGRSWLLLSLLFAGFLCPPSHQSDVCKALDGERGHPGYPGRHGRHGQKGDRGDPGDGRRLSGLTTSKGDSGAPGAPGDPGSIGYKGPEGPPGPPGDQGLAGSKGAMADGKNQRRPAFSAVYTGMKENTLLFGEILTNQEGVYDGSSGRFLCAEPGYYYFTFQAVSAGDLCLHIWAKIGTAHAKKLLSFCDRNANNRNQVNSGGAVLNLNTNDQVWIETDAKSRRIASKDASNSVFSGFLLFPRVE